MRPFRDRADAGRQLAAALAPYHDRDVVVLGLPRGGVPVAAQVAAALEAPLDAFVVRKLGLPGQEELAMGALASGGTRVVNEELVAQLGVPREVIDRVAAREAAELERRESLYRGSRPAPVVAGRVVILVDDGLATGATMVAAVRALRGLRPARIVVAVPTGSSQACAALADVADEVVCLLQPRAFAAVGLYYEDFSETSDDEVRALLGAAGVERHPGPR